ncbi:DNA-binding transcriptional regulator, AcrR family [Amycolatopsis sacchari]|uniref:DNA-binding transcriptional regulator, AcrR family n=1 Tax=Amycolatopsis sacchari TaxID=115433 RepID=A0A1I3J8I7_9PSEU|nr:TetR/AcrR family transcriptional regulator [Amycolatopsis sacchari]SFI56278.1 DNA-binding transcriptional regulator, AcrR family [Amycolatopsis sacchari]
MTRTWAGTTLADRRAARRERLLAAALDLLGTGGSSAVSVRAVCRGAKLTERYFYESFADREELVTAVYEQVAAELRQALVDAVPDRGADPAVRAEAAVTAFVELVVDDPRKGRVLLLAPVTEPALSARGVALLPAFAALVREQLPPRLPADEREMTALGLVGALANLFTAYLAGTLAVSRERLIAHCVHLLARA